MDLLLRGVRILALPSWSWEDNTCYAVLAPGEPPWRAPLPPLASPCALYAAVRVDGGTRTVVDWLVEPATWLPIDVVGDMSATTLALAAKEVGLRGGGGASREDVATAARSRDVQVAPSLGPLQGVFDGMALSDRKRAAVLANWHAFGRRERRTTRAPHAVVLAEHDDPVEVQHADFRRSSDPFLRALSAAAPAWRAARAARHAGARFSREAVERTYGAEVARLVLEREGENAPVLPREPPPPPVAAAPLELARPPVHVGPSTNLCFSHAPGAAPADAVHWFASCVATAIGHPRTSSFDRDACDVGAYASHEVWGSVYVRSVRGDEAAAAGASGERTVSRAGLVYVAHPTAAEGGCELFAAKSLGRVGLYCPYGDGRGWTAALVLRVLSLLQRGGLVYTNSVSAAFITDATRGFI